MLTNSLSEQELASLKEAINYLESPSLLMKLANLAGVPAEKLLKRAPKQLFEITEAALRKSMELSITTVLSKPNYNELEDTHSTSGWTGFWHRFAATCTGGIGGAFGLPGLAIELPISTGIMLRSISSISCEFGYDINEPGVQTECLSVFALGGPSKSDDAMDSAYLSSRLAMASVVLQATEFISTRTPQAVADALARGSAPKLIAFIARIASQFNIVVSQKFLAQSVPVIGIASGAAINNAFCGHFNSVAKYHFTICEMERRFGKDSIQQLVQQLARESRAKTTKKTNSDEENVAHGDTAQLPTVETLAVVRSTETLIN